MKKPISFILLFVILISYVHASVIGVSPSIMRFNKMLKGGYAEAEVVVSTSFTQEIQARIKPEGDMAEWVSYAPEKDSFVFSQKSPYTLNIIIQPPEDTPSGNYSGEIKFTTEELGAVSAGAGSSVIAQVIMLVYVEVIGDEIVSCRAGAISTSNAEIGEPINVRATVMNDGNIRLRPEFIIQVYDQLETKILTTDSYLGSQILPTRSKDLYNEVDLDLPIGQYFAKITLPECGVTQKTTFDIVEKGQISDSGRMIGIRTNPKVSSNEVMPIFPMFENLGQRKVVAKFKGELRNLKTDRVESVLESEQIEVNPSETVEFKMYYTPKKAGEYIVSGRVYYNNKITFDEQSKVIEVEGKDMSWIFYILAYLIIGMLIIIMLGKIKHAKKRKKF